MTERLLHSIEDAAEILSISKRVMEKLLHDGEVVSVMIGRRRLVPEDALTKYVERLVRSA